MDRELLLEIGMEEIPASWLPGLTTQLGTVLEAKLKEARLSTDEPIETFSTPRRLTVRSAKISERQTDLEELVTGPPVSAAFGPDGSLTPAGAGFVKKQNAAEDQIERVKTPKGEYIAVRKHLRGRAAVDVLPSVLTNVLRGMSFPKQMRWDAMLDDGKGELPFGRPIRWILYLYGGRVVPFAIGRSPLAAGSRVQEITSGASTYGHRFLTTSGRAGRAVKVKHFDDYRKRLAENFVVIDRHERHDRIVRELDAESRRRGGRIARSLVGQHLLDEVPDLVEYPVVVSGTFSDEFLKLPEEVLTTTMIHHQHFFPVTTDQGELLPVFLAVLNMQPDQPEIVSRNMDRVLTARLRDAQFFYQSDRQQPLSEYRPQLSSVLFHRKLGTYLDKSNRVESLAEWICDKVFERPGLSAQAGEAARLCKVDLATSMVKELSELQGVVGGIYARESGEPEEVWKAIYFHYHPVGMEANAPPSREQLGKASVTWAAVALADRLDTLVGMFSAGERPTGSRDPFGVRRAMNGIMRILIDLKTLTGLEAAPKFGDLFEKAAEPYGPIPKWDVKAAIAFSLFCVERFSGAFEQRGYDRRNVKAIVQSKAFHHISAEHARRLLDVLPEFTQTEQFQQLAKAFKRTRNLLRQVDEGPLAIARLECRSYSEHLSHSSELALHQELTLRAPKIEGAAQVGDGFRAALEQAAGFAGPIDNFFRDVMVMVDDPVVKNARLRLLYDLEQTILKLADISEIVPEDK